METLISASVVKIPLSQILPNPDNPRGSVSPEEAQAMAESLKEVGQKTEIRVRPLTEAEKAQNPGYEYLLIGGHVRLAGAKLAGLPDLKSIVVEGSTPNQELLDALLDNRWEEMSWWKWDLAIEKLLKADPNLKQNKLAAQLGVSPTKVNFAWKVTQALTPTARDLVASKILPQNSKNKVFLITQSILLALADLEDPQEVEKALIRVLDGQMIESQVRQMVANLKPGSTQPSSSRGEGFPNTPPLKKGGRGVLASEVSNSTLASASQPQNSRQPSGRLTGLLSGLFHRKTLVSAGLAGVVGAFLLKNLRRALGTLARRWMIHTMVGLGVVALLSPHLFVSVFNLFHANTSTSRPAPVPQTVIAPEPNSQSEAVPVKAVHAMPHKTTKPKVAKASIAQPQALSPELEAWAASDAPLAGEFANRFYGISYMNWDGTMDYFKAHMVEDESPVFIQQYFPQTFLREIQEKRLVLSFEASKPPQLVKVGGTRDEFLAQGTVTTVSNLNRSPQTLSKKPVALVMEIWHVQGFGTRVGTAVEVSPEEAQTLSQNAPSLPKGAPKDLGQKDKTDETGKIIGDAVGAAGKKLLGL